MGAVIARRDNVAQHRHHASRAPSASDSGGRRSLPPHIPALPLSHQTRDDPDRRRDIAELAQSYRFSKQGQAPRQTLWTETAERPIRADRWSPLPSRCDTKVGDVSTKRESSGTKGIVENSKPRGLCRKSVIFLPGRPGRDRVLVSRAPANVKGTTSASTHRGVISWQNVADPTQRRQVCHVSPSMFG